MTSIVHCRFHLGNVEWDDEEGKRGSRGRGGGNVEEEVEESKMESKMESKEEEDARSTRERRSTGKRLPPMPKSKQQQQHATKTPTFVDAMNQRAHSNTRRRGKEWLA